ncbi:MAG: hypothetical protein WAV95_09400 [Azonexus sp.]
MSDPKKSAPAAKVAATPKPPKKLVPRPAPKAEPKVAAQVEPKLEAKPAPVAAPAGAAAKSVPAAPATTAATAKARPARKPSRVDETVARHQKVLADALTQAQAIKYEPPLVVKAEAPKGKKAEKAPREKKAKLVRDSFAMPETEYAQIGELKKRLAGLRRDTKKSELLRAGIMVLAVLNDAELTAVMGRVERIKTGRPAK